MYNLQRILHFHVLICLGSHVLGSVIINGEDAPVGSMQYMVSVQNHDRHVCGGFLITENYVLTAAHCYMGTSVVLGTHNLNGRGQRIKIEYKAMHPDFTHVGFGNDLLLLKLSNAVQLDNEVKKIQIPQGDMSLNERQMCQVAGWGSTYSLGPSVPELKVVNVSVINQKTCYTEWGGLPPNVICAGGYGSDKGFCQGDSGGPLVCNGIAVGIASFNKYEKCSYPDVPNVYTDISKYHTWISKMTRGTQQST